MLRSLWTFRYLHYLSFTVFAIISLMNLVLCFVTGGINLVVSAKLVLLMHLLL